MPDEIKFCKDCKWMVPGIAPYDAKCSQPSAASQSSTYLVTGDLTSLVHCNAVRIHPCGAEAKLWEKKDANA